MTLCVLCKSYENLLRETANSPTGPLHALDHVDAEVSGAFAWGDVSEWVGNCTSGC
jgi:hypothetical protein